MYIFVLIVVLASLALDAVYPLIKSQLGDYGGGVYLLALFVLWAALSFVAHAKTLFPEENKQGVRPRQLLGYTLRFGLVLALVVHGGSLFLLVELIVFSYVSGAAFFAVLEKLKTDGFLPNLTFYPAFFCVLALFGTLLPAYVADRGRGVFAAFFRGIRQFFWSLGQLAIGPGIVLACQIGFNDAAIAAISWLDNSGAGSGLIQTADITVDAARRLIFAYVTILVAIVLSRAFLRDQSASVASGPTSEKANTATLA